MSSSAGSGGVDAGGAAESGALVTIPVICGPTASGKTEIALWLAQHAGQAPRGGGREIVVVNADSRQIYRGFDVGTAKPTPDERRRVPHRLVDVAEPTARFSAADWCELAQHAIVDARAAGRLPVVVGGTGFYISTLFRSLWAQPALQAERRHALQRSLGALDTDELRRWTERLDPARAHLGRAQLLRALEVALLTGARLSDLHVAHARPALYRPSYLLVDPGTVLAQRIAARARAMLEAGWADEVRSLVDRVPADAPAWNATGYELVRQYVLGALGRDAMLERVVIETRQYAKRQRTWFRHQLEDDRVRRVVPRSPGWQDAVAGWLSEVSEVEDAMRTSASDT